MIKQNPCKLFFYTILGHFLRLGSSKSACAILAYHRVCPHKDSNGILSELSVEPEAFEQQIKYLKERRYMIVALAELLESLEKKREINKTVTLTFDDAYQDLYEYALPILKKYDVPATIFVPTAFIESGQKFWWDRLAAILKDTPKTLLVLNWNDSTLRFKLNTEALKKKAFYSISYLFKHADDPEREDILETISENLEVRDSAVSPSCLRWDHIKEMSRARISFGAHTHTHRALSSLEPSEFKEELCLPKEILESHLRQEIDAFAYPYGEQDDFNMQSINAIKMAGYKYALTMIQGLVSLGDNVFNLPRIGIGGYDTNEIFQLKLSGLIPLYRKKKICR